MTESEVYKLFGWPLEGKDFILPACDSKEDCTPYACECGWHGIFYGAYREDVCIRCGGVLRIVGEKS